MKPSDDVQLTLDLEASADGRPPCRMCQDRGWVPRSPLGWAPCTWCEGGCEPEPEPEPEELAEDWFVVETRVYRVSAASEGDAIAAVAPDQPPVYHTAEAEPVDARRQARARAGRPALRVLA